MLTLIEEAIVERIKATLAAAACKVAVQKGVEDIRQPGIYVCTEEGRFSKLTMTTYRQELTLYVDIVFSNLAGEAERRKGVYPILMGVLQCLLLQDLGLAITPIAPKRWRHTTVEEMREKGLIAFSLELQTSYNLTVSAEASIDLMVVGLRYYLTPGDEEADAIDVLAFWDTGAEGAVSFGGSAVAMGDQAGVWSTSVVLGNEAATFGEEEAKW